MNTRWILFLIFMIFSWAISAEELLPISKKQLNFYAKAFPKIQYLKDHKILDPITPGGPNNIVRELFDTKKERLGFIRDIATTTGCDNVCNPLFFSMVFNKDGKFLTFISREALTKKNHIPMDELETESLILFLLSNNPTPVPHPQDVVDAITMETKKEYTSGVVKYAALTSYRMLDYKMQTEREIAKTILKK